MGFRGTNIPEDALWLSWEAVEELAVDLSDQMLPDVPDRLVILPRGALGPANIVSRRLNMRGHHILSAAITSYADGGVERSQLFEYGQLPTEEEVAGLGVRIIDEVCDTGHTLQEAVRILQALGAASVTSGVLHYKPGRSKTGYVPDFYATQTEKWIVYPWEVHEEPLRSVITLAEAAAMCRRISLAEAA